MASFLSFLKKKDSYSLQLYRVLGFYPKNIPLYQQAFRHKSTLNETANEPFKSNERLEFLGDAILDVIISDYLFQKFPYKNEGFLSQLRSKLVSRQFLNNLALKIGLKDLIESRLNKESYSIYGDALEALIGAIYLDKDYRHAQKFVLEKLLSNHINIEDVLFTETDFKSRVIEWAQKEKMALKFVITEHKRGENKYYLAELFISEESKGKGEAFSKKKAEQLASEEFYQKIES